MEKYGSINIVYQRTKAAVTSHWKLANNIVGDIFFLALK
jgi:hypothetical protein